MNGVKSPRTDSMINAHQSDDTVPTDPLLVQIADYAMAPLEASDLAWRTAHHCLMDSLGCALLALNFDACTRLLGPVVPGAGAGMVGGVPVPGTDHELDPVAAAFSIGTAIRWLDYNDTWLAAEWGHPSDNLGAILACADYGNRVEGRALTVRDVLSASIKAHEIQGVLALENAFNRVGIDHVLLVRVASAAVATVVLGADRDHAINAVSNAWLDGGALRTYRHAPNTGSRKSWAAGDATSRAVRLALMARAGEMGYSTALSAPRHGFQDVLFGGRPVRLAQPLGCYVMENVLFKIRFPAEFHAQTAAEAAIALHPNVRGRLDTIDRVEIQTQEPALRIIDKTGPLTNSADRDHCLQYITAVALIHGRLKAEDYEDAAAADPRIDALRARMQVVENEQYSRSYLDPAERAIPNAVQVFFNDGSHTPRIEVHYPIGHRRRRAEGVPLLRVKFASNVSTRFDKARSQTLLRWFDEPDRLAAMPVHQFMDQLRPQ